MKRYGLIGKKLNYTFSPFIHEYLMANFDCFENGTYDLIERSSFKIVNGYDGLNITNPYKADAAKLWSEASLDYFKYAGIAATEEARQFSKQVSKFAVNTLRFEKKKLVHKIFETKKHLQSRGSCHNTDVYGFLWSFKDWLKEVDRVVVLGTGSTAKMVEVISKAYDKACTLVGRGGVRQYLRGFSFAEEGDKAILVNCTPLGGNAGLGSIRDMDVSEDFVSKMNYVVDLNYSPMKTELLEIAENAGVPAKNGLEMLIVQAVVAQCLWNKIDAIKFLREHPESILGTRDAVMKNQGIFSK